MKKIQAISIRRFSQLFFLFGFLALFLQARDPLYNALPPDLLLRIDPFAGLISMIASRSIISNFWPALLIVAMAVVLGRSFCGWICPLGTSLDIWNRIIPAGVRKGNRRWKYIILLASIFLALLSIQVVWLFDPLVIFTRSLTVSIYPITLTIVDALINAGINLPFTEGIAFWLWDMAQGWLLPITPLHTAILLITLLIFIGILLLDRWGRRTWCRVLCPLGGFLGLISHISPFGRKIDESKCSSCAICSENCRMGAIDEDENVKTRRSECILCLECKYVCPELGTSFNWHRQEGGQEPFNLERRKVLGVMGTSVLFAGSWHSQLQDRTAQGYLIRPPGSVEEQKFLDLCLRCEECVKACSSTGGCLQPSSFEYGIAGFWTPRARMREGYCEFSCTLCGQVCPSGAIEALTEEVKKTHVIGWAYINRSRCIPWVTGKDCIVCEEHCPTPKKAIIFRPSDIQLPEGTMTGIKLPYVDTSLCIGCGICETKCPVSGESAIRVTNEGEQRIL